VKYIKQLLIAAVCVALSVSAYAVIFGDVASTGEQGSLGIPLPVMAVAFGTALIIFGYRKPKQN
jgi:hypothetical protein